MLSLPVVSACSWHTGAHWTWKLAPMVLGSHQADQTLSDGAVVGRSSSPEGMILGLWAAASKEKGQE